MSGFARLLVEGVSQRFGSRWVLRDLSLNFTAGTVQCILGDNGSGKTTLLRVIAGQVAAARGRCVLLDQTGRSHIPTSSLGWVGHELGLYRELTVSEHVALVARLRGVGQRDWKEALERLELGALAEAPIASLSRGQRQRVALAAALVHKPALYLLDEPLTGLDAGQARRVEGLLAEEGQRGAIVVLTVHDPAVVGRMSANGSVLVGGRLVAFQPASSAAI